MERTCVGCRATAKAEDLVRLVLGHDGEVVPDIASGAFGRGVWVHPRPECLQAAVPRGLERGLRGKVNATASGVTALIRGVAHQRVLGLLSAARRAKHAAVGTSAVKLALNNQKARLLVVATDARAAASAPWIEEAVLNGSALAFGSKAELGVAMGAAEVGVLAILDDGLAAAVRQAHTLSGLAEPGAARDAAKLTEVR